MRWSRVISPVAAFAIIVGLWEGVVRLFEIEAFLLPAPSAIWGSFWANTGLLWTYGFNTLIEALGGLLMGSVVGIGVAAAVSRWTTLRLGAMPFAAAVNAMPIVATAPIFNQLFGLTSPVSKMAVVAVMVFFPVMANTARGLAEVGTSEIELMRALAASPATVLWRVRVPNALPYFFSAMKVAVPLSLIGAIVAEYFGGPQDVLGQYIANRAQALHLHEAWAAIGVSALLGIGLYVAVLVAERAFMPWHVSVRAAE